MLLLCAAATDVVHESLNKLLVGFHDIRIADEGVNAYVKLSAGGSGIDGGGVRVHGVGHLR
jgi:hypothetical protein